MSRVTWADLRVGDLVARLVNEFRFFLGLSGRHRSLGLSTFEWVRVAQVSRGGR